MEAIPLFAIVVSVVIAFFVGRYQSRAATNVFQNRGEARLSRALTERFSQPNYYLLNHVTLRLRGETTQIDHVLVSRFGIFVIETKDYRGWIYGSPDDRYWTQVFYRAKFKFQNPLHQNYRHVCAVRELLEFLPPDAIKSSVVFTGDAQFQTAVPEGVFTIQEFLCYIDRQTAQVMSMNRFQFCVGRLETARLAMSEATDVEHIEQLRRRHRNE